MVVIFPSVVVFTVVVVVVVFPSAVFFVVVVVMFPSAAE